MLIGSLGYLRLLGNIIFALQILSFPPMRHFSSSPPLTLKVQLLQCICTFGVHACALGLHVHQEVGAHACTLV